MKNEGSLSCSPSIRQRLRGLVAGCAMMSAVLPMAANAQEIKDDHAGVFFDKFVSTEVRQGGTAKVVEWEFVNLFEKPMVVDRIEGLGDSLAADPSNPLRVDSFETGTIKILLNADDANGDFKKTIRVYFEGSQQPVELTVEVKVLKKYALPAELLASAMND